MCFSGATRGASVTARNARVVLGEKKANFQFGRTPLAKASSCCSRREQEQMATRVTSTDARVTSEVWSLGFQGWRDAVKG